jgi:hypothetical protein
VSLRTVERAVAHLRREVLAQSTATVRLETPPGHQLQIDFGIVRIPVADETRASSRNWTCPKRSFVWGRSWPGP